MNVALPTRGGRLAARQSFQQAGRILQASRLIENLFEFHRNCHAFIRAAGLSAGIRLVDERWITDSPMGEVEVAFVGPVELGVLDHDVLMPDGTVVHNPLRVLPNDEGSEVVFTLYRLSGVSDEDFERDAALVGEDLERLRTVLES